MNTIQRNALVTLMLKEDLMTFTRQTIERIVTVHIPDYDFDDEKHWYPGLGVIDWKGIGWLHEG